MTTFTARTPADLIALVPFLIGFHPTDSLVVLTFGGRHTFHARIDLPDEPEHQAEVTRQISGVVLRHRVEAVALVLYSPHAETAHAQAVDLVSTLMDRGVAVIDVVLVDRGHYRAWEPQEGFEAGPGEPVDLASHPFTAAGVFDGRVVHQDRAALAATLVGDDEDDARAVALAATRFAERSPGVRADVAAPAWLHEQALFVQRIVRRVVATRGGLSVAEAGELAVLMTVRELRDVAWAEMTRADAVAHAELWRGLARRLPDSLLPPVSALLAFAAWLSGDGALAWCAVDRCVAIDPDYSMAQHVATALENAVPPTVWVPPPAESLPALGAPQQKRAG